MYRAFEELCKVLKQGASRSPYGALQSTQAGDFSKPLGCYRKRPRDEGFMRHISKGRREDYRILYEAPKQGDAHSPWGLCLGLKRNLWSRDRPFSTFSELDNF